MRPQKPNRDEESESEIDDIELDEEEDEWETRAIKRIQIMLIMKLIVYQLKQQKVSLLNQKKVKIIYLFIDVNIYRYKYDILYSRFNIVRFQYLKIIFNILLNTIMK